MSQNRDTLLVVPLFGVHSSHCQCYTDEYITMKQMAAVRFHRNHRLMLEIFNSASVPDMRTAVNRSRLHLLKKQVQSLTIHQVWTAI